MWVKSKITIMTAVVLCFILLVLDSFIYFTLSNRLANITQSNIENEAHLIAQDYLTDQIDPKEKKMSLNTWLGQYKKGGQSIILVSPSYQILAYNGEFPIREIKSNLFTIIENHKKQEGELYHRTIQWTFLPIWNSEQILGYIILIDDTTRLTKYMDSLLTILMIGSFGAVLLASLGGYIISSIAVRPINQMIQLVERIQVNRLSERLPKPRGNDEIARLANTFNHMLDRIERSFDQQSRFVADASHEIRTPLTTIQGYANLLARWGKNDPKILDKAIRVIQNESARLRNLANNLLTLASLEVDMGRPDERAPVEETIREVIESLALLHPKITITCNIQTRSTAKIASDHLKQILINVLDNAIKYSSENGEVIVNALNRDKHVIIEIIDFGKGIPEKDLPYIVERFYRVEKSRERKSGGSGLGLAIVNELLKSYCGHLFIESEVGKGTKVTIELPMGD